MSGPDPKNNRLNTLKLDQRDLEALDARFAESYPDPGTRAARAHTRFEFRKTLILLEIIHPDGNVVRLPVVSRNLSRQGIALMHSSYVHVGSECSVCVAVPPDKWVRVPGRIARCEHRSGTTHELGIRFDEEINPREILNLNPMSGEWTREHVTPSALRGRVLVLDTDGLVHRLIDGLLKATEIEIVHATTAGEALEQAPGCDLILSEYHLEEKTGAEFTTALRDTGLPIPVLLMTGDKTPEVREQMQAAGANGFVPKPLSAKALMRALAEFMFDDATSTHTSSLPDGDPRSELIEPFVESLSETADMIEAAVESESHGSCVKVCRDLASQAASIGFEDLGRIAETALTSLLGSQNLNESARELAHLVGACRMTRVSPPAEEPAPVDEGPEEGDASRDQPPGVAEPADADGEEPPQGVGQAA